MEQQHFKPKRVWWIRQSLGSIIECKVPKRKKLSKIHNVQEAILFIERHLRRYLVLKGARFRIDSSLEINILEGQSDLMCLRRMRGSLSNCCGINCFFFFFKSEIESYSYLNQIANRTPKTPNKSASQTTETQSQIANTEPKTQITNCN